MVAAYGYSEFRQFVIKFKIWFTAWLNNIIGHCFDCTLESGNGIFWLALGVCLGRSIARSQTSNGPGSSDCMKTRFACKQQKMDAIKLGVIYLGRNFGKVWNSDTYGACARTYAPTHTYISQAAFV